MSASRNKGAINIDQSTSSRKRKILTLKTKVYIINKFENGEKICDISKRLNLPKSTVSTIVRDRNRILAASKHSALNSSTVIRKRHGIIAQMECKLKTWCEQQAEQNISFTRSEICAQAKIIFETIKKNYGEAADGETFLASKGWYCRFKHRCEENRFTEPEEESQEDEDQAIDIKRERKEDKTVLDNTEVHEKSTFCDYLKTVIKSGYTSQTVFNVDEINLYWKRVPEKSYLVLHDRNTVFNESKDRLTVLLGGNAAGDLKLKPFVIYHQENPKALRNKCKGGLPVVWKSNSKASMTACLFEDWFANHFIPEVERYCYANNIPCNVLLLLNNAIYHPPSTLLDFDHRVNVVFLPPGEVCAIQPMLEISSIFKTTYLRGTFQHLIESTNQNDFTTAEELWKDFSILDAIRIIVNSWSDIAVNNWKLTWDKLCPYFGAGEYTIVESNTIADIIETIIKLALKLEIKIDEKDVCELLDSHNKELTIEELMEMQEYSTNEEIDEDPLFDERTVTVDSLTEAFTHIKIGLNILEKIDPNEQRARVTRLGVMKLLEDYEKILNEKIKNMPQQDGGLYYHLSSKTSSMS